MTTTYLVDTNVLIDMANGKCPLTALVAKADRVLISPIVQGEYMAGVRHGDRHGAKKRAYDRFLALSNVSVPPLTATTADHYARLWQYLTDTGRRIPSNDIWIAAHAMELAATLVTADRHFDAIPNLPVLFAPAPGR